MGSMCGVGWGGGYGRDGWGRVGLVVVEVAEVGSGLTGLG